MNIRLTLTDDAKKFYRMYSVWAMALAGAIQGAWVFVPDDMKSSLPPHIVQYVTITLMVLGVTGRLTSQFSVRREPESDNRKDLP